ncbi:hypothetical protein FQA47_014472 [Oryzias melastigma]|uniref:Uncharacterized protein n=1 Tax=Oryzias melastigma TaxID=30732 RepID=A0A834FBT7_ORYME|nr:hypothetical protein FQA47_014472 [Oryzias melastigma]
MKLCLFVSSVQPSVTEAGAAAGVRVGPLSERDGRLNARAPPPRQRLTCCYASAQTLEGAGPELGVAQRNAGYDVWRYKF